MGSHVAQTLRQGVWASLTGGWYHDPEQKKFNNSCHLYLWIFLLMLPLALHLALPPTTMALSIYCASVTVFFVLVKTANYRLHVLFDEGEAVVRSSLSDLSRAADKKSNAASDACLPSKIRKSSTVPDSVAMTMLARKRPSQVIQVTVKQTETDAGLIGVECSKSDEGKTVEVACNAESTTDEKPGPRLSPEPPEKDAPLLQAQQRPPSPNERQETEFVDVDNKEVPDEEGQEEKVSEKEEACRETSEVLPPREGNEDGGVEDGSEGHKGPSDANNNSLETARPQPDPATQV